MANLKKEILNKQRSIVDGNKADESLKLLSETINKDHELLSMVGLSNNELDSNLKSFDEYLRVSKYEDNYGSCVGEETIKELAYKYNLKLLHTSHYRYSVPLHITEDIKNWKERLGDKFNNYPDHFYVLAPAEHFYEERESIKGKKKMCKYDPILLYKIVDDRRNGNTYSIISEWGSDLNIFRRVKAFFMNNLKTVSIVTSVVLTFLLTFLSGGFVYNLTKGLEGNDWVTIITMIIVFAGLVLFIVPFLKLFEFENIKKDSDYKSTYRNHRLFAIKDMYGGITREFGVLYLNTSLWFILMSFIFIICFCMSGNPSFSDELNISDMVFFTPLLISISTLLFGLVSGFYKNIKTAM